MKNMLKTEKNNLASTNLIKIGRNFLGILNDLKRRPEDAAIELNVSLEEIQSIIEGRIELSSEIVDHAEKIWPVNKRDFYVIDDDCYTGVKIMTAEESKKSSRIMERAGKPYYEYRDTAMSRIAPFRPEWIMELCHVDDNDPENNSIQWNNGHFMHQFTYFVGEVNFYYKDNNGEKKVALMNTGDSMYITPFVSHTFATRNNTKSNGLILAITYGGKLTGDVQQELSSLSNLGVEYALDFSTKNSSIISLLKYFCEISSISIDELSKRVGIKKEQILDYEAGKISIPYDILQKIAEALNVNLRDLLPNDKIEKKVIVQKHNDGKKWSYPNLTRCYEFLELAHTNTLPFSKAFELEVNNTNDKKLDLRAGLHQYVYNTGNNPIVINWEFDGKEFSENIESGDSLYIKPFIKHNFRGNGKLLISRIGGKVVGDSQRELSFIGKNNTERAISETMQWFNPKGNN